jgi:hypothetical protein
MGEVSMEVDVDGEAVNLIRYVQLCLQTWPGSGVPQQPVLHTRQHYQVVAKSPHALARQMTVSVVQPWWIQHPNNLAKINVEAAVSRADNRGAAAAICRDSNGIYLGASAVGFEGLSDRPAWILWHAGKHWR